MVSYFGKRSKEKASDHEEGSSQGGGEQWDGKEITSSMEKFSRFGFLTPALVLVPAADGVRYCKPLSSTIGLEFS